MEAQLTDKLLKINLKEEKDVSRNTLGDCLFMCFAHAVKSFSQHVRAATMDKVTKKVTCPLPTHAKKPVHQKTIVDVTTVAGLRLLAADSARAMESTSTPSANAALLRRHILFRSQSASMLARDRRASRSSQNIPQGHSLSGERSRPSARRDRSSESIRRRGLR